MKQIDQAAILDELLAGSREPFAELLSRFLFFAPNDTALMLLANTKPADWAKAIAPLAKLAGYHDKLEVSGSINHIHSLGDAELLARLAEARAQRAPEQEQPPQHKPKELLLLSDQRSATPTD